MMIVTRLLTNSPIVRSDIVPVISPQPVVPYHFGAMLHVVVSKILMPL